MSSLQVPRSSTEKEVQELINGWIQQHPHLQFSHKIVGLSVMVLVFNERPASTDRGAAS